MSVKNWIEYFGRVFKREAYVPEGMAICDNCLRLCLKEDIHEIIQYMNNKNITLRICEECADTPPLTWRKKTRR